MKPLCFLTFLFLIIQGCSYFNSGISFDEKKQIIKLDSNLIGKSINIDEMKMEKGGLNYQYYCDSCRSSIISTKDNYYLDSLSLKRNRTYRFSIIHGDEISYVNVYVDSNGIGRIR